MWVESDVCWVSFRSYLYSGVLAWFMQDINRKVQFTTDVFWVQCFLYQCSGCWRFVLSCWCLSLLFVTVLVTLVVVLFFVLVICQWSNWFAALVVDGSRLLRSGIKKNGRHRILILDVVSRCCCWSCVSVLCWRCRLCTFWGRGLVRILGGQKVNVSSSELSNLLSTNVGPSLAQCFVSWYRCYWFGENVVHILVGQKVNDSYSGGIFAEHRVRFPLTSLVSDYW